MTRIFAAIFLVAMMAGCATGYQAEGMGGGFSETWIQEDTLQVRYSGNGYTSEAESKDYALLRAAEVMQQNGHSHIVYTGSINSYPSGTMYGNVVYKKAVDLKAKAVAPDHPDALDVEFLSNSLRQKYGLE